MDVSEIRFEALARKVAQRDERFLMPRAALAHITLDLSIAAAVVVFVTKPPADLSCSVALLARGGLVVGQDLVNDRVKRPKPGSEPVPGQRLWVRFCMCESMPNDSARVSELPGDLSNGHTIAMSPPNCSVVIHGYHVLSLRAGERSM